MELKIKYHQNTKALTSKQSKSGRFNTKDQTPNQIKPIHHLLLILIIDSIKIEFLNIPKSWRPNLAKSPVFFLKMRVRTNQSNIKAENNQFQDLINDPRIANVLYKNMK